MYNHIAQGKLMGTNVLEAVRRKITVVEASLPIKPIDKAIGQAIDVFDAHLATSSRPLEFTNPFGSWQEISPDAAREKIQDHLSTADENSKLLDACRAIGSIKVVVFKGKRQSSGLSMDLTVDEFTRLGDGTALHSPQDGWTFSQRKGEHPHTSHLRVRHK